MDEHPNAALIAELRALADYYELHPEADPPEETILEFDPSASEQLAHASAIGLSSTTTVTPPEWRAISAAV